MAIEYPRSGRFLHTTKRYGADISPSISSTITHIRTGILFTILERLKISDHVPSFLYFSQSVDEKNNAVGAFVAIFGVKRTISSQFVLPSMSNAFSWL
ncbi:MAG: hypothetical protein BWY64_00871 [bacterium ADurb.Bin363]|nr:MAG: hypothetical protein BWY64_00871 [bacterium ADurb.Bin363]